MFDIEVKAVCYIAVIQDIMNYSFKKEFISFVIWLRKVNSQKFRYARKYLKIDILVTTKFNNLIVTINYSEFNFRVEWLQWNFIMKCSLYNADAFSRGVPSFRTRYFNKSADSRTYSMSAVTKFRNNEITNSFSFACREGRRRTRGRWRWRKLPRPLNTKPQSLDRSVFCSTPFLPTITKNIAF